MFLSFSRYERLESCAFNAEATLKFSVFLHYIEVHSDRNWTQRTDHAIITDIMSLSQVDFQVFQMTT
jgi:hypothetical protein